MPYKGHRQVPATRLRQGMVRMDAPEVTIARYAASVSHWALLVSGGSFAVSACALVLEVRRWLTEGVRLTLSIVAEAKLFGGPVKDDATYLVASVTNRGDAPTTITHMVLFNYPSRLAIW